MSYTQKCQELYFNASVHCELSFLGCGIRGGGHKKLNIIFKDIHVFKNYFQFLSLKRAQDVVSQSDLKNS